MIGLTIKRAKLIHEDDRRKIVSLLNGEIGVRDMHILYMKKGDSILGNHWHTFPEMMYVMRGSVHYWLKHMITGETEELDVSEGDIMFKTGFIVHTGLASEDAILLDGSSESWIDNNFNNHSEIIHGENK